MLYLLDKLLFSFHAVLILFNMFGWIWPRTRKWHLATLGLTIFSWYVLGIWQGFGYCFCTDWHFQVRRELGIPVPETSYIQLLVRAFTGVLIERFTADILAFSVLLYILVATAWVWTRDLRARRAPRIKVETAAPASPEPPASTT